MLSPETLREIIVVGVDLALVILVVEAAVLSLFRWRTGRGISLQSTALISLSGLGLLVALKAALMQANPLWIVSGLMVGGIAHAIDLIRRIRMQDRNV